MNSIPAWAVRGAKVVCTGAYQYDTPFGESVPVAGSIYTLRDVFWLHGAARCFLVEITNPTFPYSDGVAECDFNLDGFRPLTTRTQKQDVAQFLPLLKPSPDLIPATDDETVNALAGAVFGEGNL